MFFTKLLSTLLILLLIFPSTVLPMQEDVEERIQILTTPNKKKESCSYGGFSHWFSGTGEYFERSFPYGSNKADGRYPIEDAYSSKIVQTSTDGWILSDFADDGVCSNPIVGTLSHLCCLPCSCCDCSKQNPSIYKKPKQNSEPCQAVLHFTPSSILPPPNY